VRLHAEQKVASAGRDGAAEIVQLVMTSRLQLLNRTGDARPRLLLVHLPELFKVLLLALLELRLALLGLLLGLRLALLGLLLGSRLALLGLLLGLRLSRG
jgi:hypothetical protein